MDDLEGSGGDRGLTKTTGGMPFVGEVGKGGGIGRRDEALCAYLKEMTRMWLHTIQVCVCVCVCVRARVSGWWVCFVQCLGESGLTAYHSGICTWCSSVARMQFVDIS